MIQRSKVRNQQFRLGFERLECREVMTVTPVKMIPGSELQTNFKSNDGDLGINVGSSFIMTRDANNNPIDFNKDGNTDAVVIGNETIDSTKVTVTSIVASPILANSYGQFRNTTVGNTTHTSETKTAVVLDWNGDGYQDLISAGGLSLNLEIFQNNGKGEFTKVINQDLGIRSELRNYAITADDFNQDGAPDFLMQAKNSEWFIGFGQVVDGKWNGQINTGSIQYLNALNGPYHTSVKGDFNQDGKTDFAIGAGNGVRLFINDGTGHFPANGSMDLASVESINNFFLAVGDWNKDGKPDLASTRNLEGDQSNLTPLSIYLNTTAAPTSANPTFATSTRAVGGTSFSGPIAVADMNLDGNLDLVVSAFSTNVGALEVNFTTYLGNGQGAFEESGSFLGFSKAWSTSGGIGIGDWNHDGQMDVAMAAMWNNAKVSTVSNAVYSITVGVSLNDTFINPGVVQTKLPNATANSLYSYQLTFINGDPSLPYSVTLAPYSLKLPAGLTLSPTGLISGTPTQSGAFQLTLNVAQPNGLHGLSNVYLPVDATSPVVITPGSLPNAVAGVPFNQPFSASGGAATWAITAGALPPGLVLSPNGVLRGTATGTGQYNFQITATGSGFQASVPYSMVVQAVGAPIVTSLKRFGYHAQPTTL
ncbi:MAG: FG-GAP-like repeat-containing protein, partial [bacterium]